MTALIDSGVIYAGPRTKGHVSNIGLAAGTTSASGDSITITGANGSSLSVDNPGHITLDTGLTSGNFKTFTITSDITIDLTGAHWGFGTLGDLTDQILSVYAINDAGTLKWGVAVYPYYFSISNSLSSATGTDINLATETLVNSALSAASPCSRIGWFKADFDDTGGSSEDLWSVSSSTDDLNISEPLDPDSAREKYHMYGSPTLASSWTSNYYFSNFDIIHGLGFATYTSNDTQGDKITINRSGHYSVNISLTASLTAANHYLVIGVYTDQTASGDGNPFAYVTVNSVNFTYTAIESGGTSHWLDAGDVLTVKLVAQGGTPTVNGLTIFLDGVVLDHR